MGASRGQNQYRPLLDELARQGWRVETLNSGHWRAFPPDKGQPMVHFCQSGKPRSFANAIAQLRRSGFRWERDEKEEPVARADQGVGEEGERLTTELYDRPTWVDGARLIAAHEKVAPAAQAKTAPAVIDHEATKTVDQLFAELKAARGYAQLAAEHLREVEQALEKARLDHAGAEEERRRADAELAEAKRAFTDAFDAGAA